MDIFLSGLFGALIGGVAALVGAAISGHFALKAAREAAKANLDSSKEQELRRQQVLAVVGMIASRAALSANASVSERSEFLRHLNALAGAFAGSTEVQNRVRSFHANRTNERFILLVRAAANEAGMDLTALADSDIENVFT